MNQSRDRPPPWPDVWWHRMHLAFAAWNADVQAARDEYDEIRASESDARMCNKGLHKMTPENVTRGTSWRCRACKNAYAMAYYRTHGRKKAA